jgi:hypothetical protein
MCWDKARLIDEGGEARQSKGGWGGGDRRVFSVSPYSKNPLKMGHESHAT